MGRKVEQREVVAVVGCQASLVDQESNHTV